MEILVAYGDLETDDLVVVADPHEVWEQYELGCPGVVATMLPELSEQQRRLLGAS